MCPQPSPPPDVLGSTVLGSGPWVLRTFPEAGKSCLLSLAHPCLWHSVALAMPRGRLTTKRGQGFEFLEMKFPYGEK